MRVQLAFVLFFIVQSLAAQPITNELLTIINSAYDELNPVFTADGQTLYFTVANHPSNIGGKKDPGDIWYSKRSGSQWLAPVHAGKEINNRAYNAVAGVSSDGSTLYLLSHYEASGNNAQSQGIAMATNTGNGWSFPQNIYIPYFLNKSNMICGSMSADNRIFVFSAESYGTRGVDDLYVSFNENGKWTEPKNLGASVNTSFQELSPWLSADNRTLYFSSNGRKGIGSFDVYTTSRLDDSWTSWSEPINVGGSINSEGREIFFRDLKHLGVSVFTSTKNSDGYGDIKVQQYNNPVNIQIPVASTSNTPDTTLKFVEVKPPAESTRKNTVKVYGKVIDVKTGKPVEATLSFAGPEMYHQPTQATSSNGYTVDIPSSKVYAIKIEAPGYISTLEKLDINTFEMHELELNFSLQPVALGTTVNLKNVLFVQAKSELLPESFDELDLVVSFLKTNQNVKIELSGHTDNRGVHADNVRLSQQRVNVVKDYLVSKGIDQKRISGKGYGGTKPLASNDTEETRKMNRRVEFTIRKY